ncbi:MAG: MFS transporter [Verrucomicrobiaceae bacterium]|nr:MAG: MFS transporter [Verrucomicrobiaceae bacterium]
MNSPAKSSILPILLLSAAGFTILTTEFVIVGLLPSMAKDLGVSVPQAGLLVTLFAFTVAAVGPALTAWLSKYDRKKLFVGTLLLFGISNVLAATAPNIGVMAFARFIPAIILPVFWALASETAVDITGPEKAGKAISMVSFGIVAATIFGIPVGTLISDTFGWRAAFGSLAVLSFVKAAGLLVFLPKVPLKKNPASFASQFGILREPKIVGHVLLSLVVFAGMFTAYTYLADILEKLAGFDGATVGWILMGFGGVGMIGNWIGGRIVDRSPLGATILFALPLAIATMVLVPVIHSKVLLGVMLAFWGISQAALFTVSHVRVMKAASETPALGASLNISGANAGIGIGAIIGGRVIDANGLDNIGGAAAGVMLLAIALAFILKLSNAPRFSRQAAVPTCE